MALIKNDNRKKSLIIFIAITILVILITVSAIIFFGNTDNFYSDNNIYDENYTTKAYCLYDAGQFEKQDGSIKITLEGSSDNTKVSVIEKIERKDLTWNDLYKICENRKAEIEKLAHSSFDYDIDTRKDSVGNTIYTYELTYEYKTRDNINTIIAELENKGYECMILSGDNVNEASKNIIGKWVSKEKAYQYFIFNEDGTGTYYYGKNSDLKYDFYYSYNGNDVIKYSYSTLNLELGYDIENNVIYKGGVSSTETGKILLDEKYNEPFYKSN